MNSTYLRRGLLAGGVLLLAASQQARADDDFVAQAKAFVAKVTAPSAAWDGPTTGPKAVPDKLIIYVSTDQRNSGVRAAGDGVEEAAGVIGWKFRAIDGRGTMDGELTALSQAVALKPAGIVIGGIDAASHADAIEQAAARGIKVVGWHVGPKPGPIASPPVVFNINTEPPEVGKAAAMYAVADSNGTAGVVIFTDHVYGMAVAKSDAMAAVIKQCGGCALLDVINAPLATTSERMSQLTTSLLQRFGKKWTYSMGINDLYYDFMAPALQAAGIPGDGYPRNISGGDGSPSAFQRIRRKEYQVGTAADPLRLQGWQCVDEMNRAFAGAPASGYVPPVHLFTTANIGTDGGPHDVFDPDNGYRAHYKTIWGK